LERLKLLWDFRGPDAHKIALHHEVHLKEYAFAKALNTPITGVQVEMLWNPYEMP